MKQYEKPIIEISSDLAEGVYAASGAGNVGAPGCDSKYMNGVYQSPTYSWEGDVKTCYGCLDCPAFRPTHCGVAEGNDYNASGNAGSYDNDAGNRKPKWEQKGFTPETKMDESVHAVMN